MPVSPLSDDEGVLSVTVTCNDEPLDAAVALVSVAVRQVANQLPTARLVVADGNMPEGTWPLADGKAFEPGARLRISAGHGGQAQPLFDGVVARLGLQLLGDNTRQLQVDCVHAAVVMCSERRSRVHANQTDGELMRGLIRAHGLQAEVDTTAPRHAALAQHGCSDWDFLVARAAANGLQVLAEDGRVRVQAPDPQAQAALIVTWGTDLMDFQAEAAPVPRGRLRFPGHAAARVGATIALAGLGRHFKQQQLIQAVSHTLADGVWETEVEFGPAPLAAADTAAAAAPAGALPAPTGLQLGHVTQVGPDPAGELGLQVRLPQWQAPQDTLWARLAQPQASAGFGTVFVPQVGDEVVIGFVAGDAARPVVLGSLYGSTRQAPEAASPAHGAVALTTRNGLRLVLDDPQRRISLSTPAGRQVLLDDGADALQLKDRHDNAVTLDSHGITLETPKNLALKAGGTLTLEATGALTLRSQADVQCSGLNLCCEAQVAFRGTGGAMAELSAAGETVVKGAMVLIN
ncbi:MAG: hypothetical protein HY855_00015 [Burkholderiales bacterium]|nr:hypothetical protein [Burkholderiales bacterium]